MTTTLDSDFLDFCLRVSESYNVQCFARANGATVVMNNPQAGGNPVGDVVSYVASCIKSTDRGVTLKIRIVEMESGLAYDFTRRGASVLTKKISRPFNSQGQPNWI